MSLHYVTFPHRYTHERHPFFGRCPELPAYYGTVEAPDYRRATELVRAAFGEAWAMLYIHPPDPDYATLGRLFHLRPDTAGQPVLTFAGDDEDPDLYHPRRDT